MGVSEKTLISADEILKYIPQRAPIVMIDEFFGVDGNVSDSGLTIDEENIFCEGDVFSECGIIEHIAQSAAMRMGYTYRSRGKDVPLGYIGSINKFRLFEGVPRIGDKLRTRIVIEHEVMNISLISARVKVADKLIAECQMKIYLQE